MHEQNILRRVGWASATAGARVAVSVTFIGLAALFGRLLGFVDPHPALDAVIWVSAAVAVVPVYVGLGSSRATAQRRRALALVALAATAVLLVRGITVLSGVPLIAAVGIGVITGTVAIALLFTGTPVSDTD